MLITTQWSVPKMLTQGKNIRVRASGCKLTVSVFNANEGSYEKSVGEDERIVEISAEVIARYSPAMIRFKSGAGECHVEMETF